MVALGEHATWLDIHVDAGGNRARRIVQRLIEANNTTAQV
jgi:hypothetical protein